MVSITNFPNGKPLRSLGVIPQNLSKRIPPARNSRFQNILSALEARNSNNTYKTRGLTIADYRARAVIPRSRYRRLPQPADAQLKNAVSNRFPARAALDVPQRPEHKIKDKEPFETPFNKTRPQPVALSDQQIIKQNVQRAAAKYNLPPELITAVIRAESNFKVSAVSSAGAQGLMQLMPATAKELGVKNPFDIEQNIDGGTKYLRKMLDRFGGSVRKALAAYNAGPGTVTKYNGRVPYPETRQYVKRVLRFSRQMI
jgi:soluble lytic murein transglycosylase-like protein